jgi:rhodanese-related sulfurtransferase
MANTAAEMVARARARIENLDVERTERELASGALLVDIREQEERVTAGVIAGAFHAPRGLLEFWADPTHPLHKAELDPSRRIVLHCASGGRSALAAETLQQLGFRSVAHLDGGINAWRTAGKPVARIQP